MPGVIRGRRAGDVGLPLVQVGIAHPARTNPGDTIMTVSALVDTGADQCCLRSDVARSLGLTIKPTVLEATGAFMVGAAHPADVVLSFHTEPGPGHLPMTMAIEVVVLDSLTEPFILGWLALRHFDLKFSRGSAFSLRSHP